MFIYNCKINSKLLFKFLLIILFSCAIIILIYVLSKFINTTKKDNTFTNNDNTITTEDSIPTNDINNIKSTNYTTILKATHENIDNYIGLKINFTGYVYRISDFNDNQFVLARNMIISSNLQYVVVGFLCEYPQSSQYSSNSWVNVTGTITHGQYNNKDIPIIKVSDIQIVKEPTDSLVYPPDENYIPTISMF